MKRKRNHSIRKHGWLCCAALCLLGCCKRHQMNDYELRDLATRSRGSMNSRERAIWELGNRGRQDLLLELLKGYTAGDDVLISDTLRQLQGSSDQKVYNILSELHRRTTEEGNVIHGETNAEILDAMKRFRMEQ